LLRWNEVHTDRWDLVRRLVGGAVNVVLVAAVGRVLLWVLELMLGTSEGDTVIEAIKQWFPRIGLGGLLLHYVIDVAFFLAHSLRKEWNALRG